jgi:hypothetical protein
MSLSLPSWSHADIVAEWTDFTAPDFDATTGMGEISVLNIMFPGTVGGGTALTVTSPGNNWNVVTLDVAFSGSLFEDFMLMYDVVRDDGNGQGNAAPDTISWSASVNNGPFQSVGSNSVVVGANAGLMIDLTSQTQLNNASSIVLQASFANASGGNVNSLAFDNISITATAVPEPSSFALLGLIGCAVTGVRYGKGRWYGVSA